TCHSPDLSSTERAKPASGGAPAGALAGAAMPACAASPSHSKSVRDVIRPYRRGTGLSLAALRDGRPRQRAAVVCTQHAAARGHYGSHLGVNRGSFRAPVASSDAVGGGRRG